MKLKILAASIALAFSSAYAQTTANWGTAEYSRSRALQSVNASTAYTRGYTGKGIKIAILDSGIDTKHWDFQNGKILLVRDFTSSGSVADNIGHGTHVAGTAAGARNGLGTHGVAFDANLLIGKITNSGLVTVNSIPVALNWAANNGAAVANLSLNFTLRQTTISAVQVGQGIYKTNFTNTGSLPGGLNAAQWASSIGPDMVLVVAAGNDSTPWSGGLSTLSYATDNKGQLVLGGRMLVAGNWNQQTNKGTGPGNNGAAHLCLVMVGNTCQDKFKLSDFYIMAPGTGITSSVPTTVNKTGQSTMTGTSMAAPTVSGGVALVRQMWPQMTGSNVVKLLLVTANKNLPNYSPITMGQGLMDLDRATRPIGSLGIPTTGRISSASAMVGSAILSTNGSASTGKVSNIMLVDSFDRDFYVEGKHFTSRKESDYNLNQNLMLYASRNGYSQLNNYAEYYSVRNGEVNVKLFKEKEGQTMINADFAKDYGSTKLVLSGGTFNESKTWLGNSLGSSDDTLANRASSTGYIGFGIEQALTASTGVYANFYNGVTVTKSGNAVISKIGSVHSHTWTAGFEHHLSKSSQFGFMVYQPVLAHQAQADVNLPVGLDSEFNVVQAKQANLSADVRELRSGVYYRIGSETVNAMTFIESRQNYKGQLGAKDTAIGVTFKMNF